MRRLNVKHCNVSIGSVECEEPVTWAAIRKALLRSDPNQQHFVFLDTRRDDVNIPIAASDETSECFEGLTEIHIRELLESPSEEREYSARPFFHPKEDAGAVWAVLDENGVCVGSFCCVGSTKLDIVRVLIKSRCYIGRGIQWRFVVSLIEIPLELEVHHRIEEVTPFGQVSIRTKSINQGEFEFALVDANPHGMQCVQLTCEVM